MVVSDVVLVIKFDVVVEGNVMLELVVSMVLVVKLLVMIVIEFVVLIVNVVVDLELVELELIEVECYDEGLKKLWKMFGDCINVFLVNFCYVDEVFFDDLEDMLIEFDVGYEIVMWISDELCDEVKLKNVKSKKEILSVIVEKFVDMYGEVGEGEDNLIYMVKSGLIVILFVGVNGVGKIIIIGKMVNMYK